MFLASVPDSGTRLAAANLSCGLAKIHYLQESLGLTSDAFFVGMPDMSTPRYTTRWQWGLGIGGKLVWGDGHHELMILDLQIGTSTALVGGLSKKPMLETLLAKINRLRRNDLVVMGVNVDWDFDRGNHFINCYRVKPLEDIRLPPYIFVVHGGDTEVKQPSALGMGLDYEKSPSLRHRMKVVNTPLGPVRILTGRDARAYFASYQIYETYSKQKRLLIAERLFDHFDLISNEIHHGLTNANEALLGCYRFTPDVPTLYPITLRSDLPAFLVRGITNLAPEVIHEVGSSETARNLGICDRLTQANVLPHGGGYTYPEVADVADIQVVEKHRYFVLKATTGGAKRVLENLTTLPFVYRGLEVMEYIERWKLGKAVAKLVPLYSITA